MPRQSRGDEIAALLRDEILRGQYRPGERLPSERDLAQRFATSRGAVREALRKLEQLGIADIRPGGARVQEVSDASLEAIGHLLDLQMPPNPELVDQVLEVVGALLAATVRIGVERASDAELERVRELALRMQAPDLGESDRLFAMHELGERFLAASGNVVLGIIRKSLKTQFVPRLLRAGIVPRWPDSELLTKLLADFSRALDLRDAAAASEAVHRLWRLNREGVRRSLETLHASASPTPLDGAPR